MASTLYEYNGSSWKLMYPYANVDGTNWKICDFYVNVSSTWKPIYLNYALFGGGGYSGSTYSYTAQYFYTTSSVVTGTSLTYAVYDPAAAGNTMIGIFGGGTRNYDGSYPITYTNKYTYGDNSLAAGTVLYNAGYGSSAAGNATQAIFGTTFYVGQGSASKGSKYVYSGDTVTQLSTSTPPTQSNVLYGATGNSTRGVFAGGTDYALSYAYNSFNLYLYSNDSNTTESVYLSNSVYALSATSSPTIGYFMGGADMSNNCYSSSRKYTYSSDTATNGSYLYNYDPRAGQGAAGNPAIGVFSGGFYDSSATPSLTTNIYTYSNDTCALGTNLNYYSYGIAATSTQPGGFN